MRFKQVHEGPKAVPIEDIAFGRLFVSPGGRVGIKVGNPSAVAWLEGDTMLQDSIPGTYVHAAEQVGEWKYRLIG